jgi:hypothetical protein
MRFRPETKSNEQIFAAFQTPTKMFNDQRFAKFSLCIYDKMLNIKKDFHSVENVSRDRDIVDYGYAVENVNKISHACRPC